VEVEPAPEDPDFEVQLEDVVLLPVLQMVGTRQYGPALGTDDAPGQRHDPTLAGPLERTYTIFEGTSEIQRLVVARAVSGVHIP
jgi:hypothetical protein